MPGFDESRPSLFENRATTDALEHRASLYGGLGHATWYPEIDESATPLKDVKKELAPVQPPRVIHAHNLQLGYVSVSPMVVE